MDTSDITTIEEWRDVPGYEGWYQASSFGRIKRLPRYDVRGYKFPERILISEPQKRGYRAVNISKDGRQRCFKVHLLIARTFLGECPEEYEVNHIDTDRNNNALRNLEYITHKKNMEHASAHGLMKVRSNNTTEPEKVYKNPNRITPEKRQEIRRLRSLGYTCSSIGAKFIVSRQWVQQLTSDIPKPKRRRKQKLIP